MKETIEIDNLKCGGCGNTIRKKLLIINGVTEAKAIPEKGVVEIEMNEDVVSLVIETLSNLGYPPAGTTNNLQKIKSYASCVVGRIN